MTNLIETFLTSKSVNLPPNPQDLSQAFRTSGVNCGYAIVMTGRSGSTWLASALAQIPGYGNPIEYFNEHTLPYYWKYDSPQDFSTVFNGIVAQNAEQGCFGFKISPQRLFWLGQMIDLEKTLAPEIVSWIDMRRWNLVKQALSFAVAKKSGVWHAYTKDGNAAAETKMEVDDNDIWKELIAIILQEQTLDKFCRNTNISPLKIYYEEILDSKAALLARVCAYVRPGWKYDISKVVDGTAKLDKSGYSLREQEFTEKHADALNEIYSNRANVDLAQLRRRVMVT